MTNFKFAFSESVRENVHTLTKAMCLLSFLIFRATLERLEITLTSNLEEKISKMVIKSEPIRV